MFAGYRHCKKCGKALMGLFDGALCEECEKGENSRMTKDEALQILDTIPTISEQVDALEMAIKALEQQTCEDAISRKDIQDYIAKYLSQYLYEDVRQAVEVIDAYIGDMPSVTQKSGKWIDGVHAMGYREGYKDAQKQKSGKWIRVTDKSGHLVWECDKCGWQQRFNTNFCPECGAKMESEDKE